MTPTLLLASNSPRRRQILALTGWSFAVRPVDIDERPLPGESPADYVLRLAEGKAAAARAFIRPGDILLAADTTVADGERILGKPEDADDARSMLRSLRGRFHTVYTAIGVSRSPDGLLTDLCSTQVLMRNYTDEEIETYIASGDPFDKAGAYAIQNPEFHPVEGIEGCYACVMGLPLCHVIRAMKMFGLTPQNDMASDCPEHLQINTPCPHVERILRTGL